MRRQKECGDKNNAETKRMRRQKKCGDKKNAETKRMRKQKDADTKRCRYKKMQIQKDAETTNSLFGTKFGIFLINQSGFFVGKRSPHFTCFFFFILDFLLGNRKINDVLLKLKESAFFLLGFFFFETDKKKSKSLESLTYLLNLFTILKSKIRC